jgi:pimeloyl-ACP methyl ester carboxylesterase
MVAALVQTITLVGHSYAGFVITNAAYNNPNITELVHIATFALDEGQLLSNFNRYL